MKDGKEVGEVRDAKEVKEENAQAAAFFDLDGTLMLLPSLEQRFFRILRYRQEIPLKNYFLWMREALRLLPRGISALLHANKMYLRGVQCFAEDELESRSESFSTLRNFGESDAEDCRALSAHA